MYTSLVPPDTQYVYCQCANWKIIYRSLLFNQQKQSAKRLLTPHRKDMSLLHSILETQQHHFDFVINIHRVPGMPLNLFIWFGTLKCRETFQELELCIDFIHLWFIYFISITMVSIRVYEYLRSQHRISLTTSTTQFILQAPNCITHRCYTLHTKFSFFFFANMSCRNTFLNESTFDWM